MHTGYFPPLVKQKHCRVRVQNVYAHMKGLVAEHIICMCDEGVLITHISVWNALLSPATGYYHISLFIHLTANFPAQF